MKYPLCGLLLLFLCVSKQIPVALHKTASVVSSRARTIEVLMQTHIAGPKLWSQALEISFPHALTPVSTLVCHLELVWTPSQVSPGIVTEQRRRVGTSCLKHSHSLWKVRDQNNKIKQQVRSVVRWCLFPWLVIVSTERRPCACLRFLIPKRMDLKNGSAGIGARCQAWQPKFHSKTYVMEGQKWLSQVVLWSLWACCGT